MFYKTILFMYDNKKSYCVFDELMYNDFIFRQTNDIIYDSSNYTKYISTWLKNFEIINSNLSIDIIGVVDTIFESDYYIVIDEKTKIIKINSNEFIFDNYYNQFICENNLWTGIDYTDDESKLNLDIKKNIIKKYLF